MIADQGGCRAADARLRERNHYIGNNAATLLEIDTAAAGES